MSHDTHHPGGHSGSHSAAHAAEHEQKPFAHPLGILAGLIILWVASGAITWVILKLFMHGESA